MPISPTYPGVYIEEVPSGVRSITGVSTSIAAFIGFFKKEDSELKNWSMMVSFNQMGVIDILFCAIFNENEKSYGGITTRWKGAMNASKPNVDVTFLNSTVKE